MHLICLFCLIHLLCLFQPIHLFFSQVENFAEIGDPGEAWFGEEAAARMVNWLAGAQNLQIVKRFVSKKSNGLPKLQIKSQLLKEYEM